jgi:NAD-dependent dihydropyrimidine dehydrogenase PreA subunit
MRYLENAVTLNFDVGRCNGCGTCTEVCPHAVFVMANKRAVLSDRGACMECGACARNCASGAITVKAGVGCAAAIIGGMLRGTEPACGCGNAAERGSPGCC